MHPEYFHNNDTEEMTRYVQRLVETDEPALRAHCQEVSRQTDTSYLGLREMCADKVREVHAIIGTMAEGLRKLSQALSQNAGVFRTQDGQADFPVVCSAVTRVEGERKQLLWGILALSQVREELAVGVAQLNRILHFLSIAKHSVPEGVQPYYTKEIDSIETVYERTTRMDAALLEVQMASMTLVESHLSAFMKKLRAVTDFNHAGKALDRAEIRSLCGELLILLERIPNVSF